MVSPGPTSEMARSPNFFIAAKGAAPWRSAVEVGAEQMSGFAAAKDDKNIPRTRGMMETQSRGTA